MIYTIGKTEVYDLELSSRDDVNKIGKRKDYIGGIIFETAGEAETAISEHSLKGFSVYKLDGTLMDSYVYAKDKHRYLKHNVKIIGKHI